MYCATAAAVKGRMRMNGKKGNRKRKDYKRGNGKIVIFSFQLRHTCLIQLFLHVPLLLTESVTFALHFRLQDYKGVYF